MNTINNTMENTNNITKYSKLKKKVLCLETGVMFESATEAAMELNCSIDLISSVCRGKTKTAKGMHFKYVDDVAKLNHEIATPSDDPKEIIIAPKAIIKGKGKRNNGNTNAVICMTTGEVFTSCTDAAEKIGTTVGHMSCVCRGHGHTAKGRKFCYVKDIDEHLGEVVDSIRKANMYDEVMTYEEKRKELIAAIQHQKDMIVYFEEKLAEAHMLLADAEKEMHDFMYR